MVVSPLKDLKMVPTVHTSNQNVLEALLNSFLNVGEDVRNEEILLSTEHVLQKALLTLGLSFFLHMLDPQLLSFARTFVDLDVGIIIFIIFDAKDSVDNALKPTDDKHNIALLIDDQMVKPLIITNDSPWLNDLWLNGNLRCLFLDYLPLISYLFWFGEKLDIDFLQELTETVNEPHNMESKIVFKLIVLLSKLS